MTLGQRWPNVGWLAFGWRWLVDVGPTLGQRSHANHCQSLLALAYMRWANVGPTLRCQPYKMMCIGPTLAQHWPNTDFEKMKSSVFFL
jgi:hypothetical protein